MKTTNPSRGKEFSGGSIILTASGKPYPIHMLFATDRVCFQSLAFVPVRGPPNVSQGHTMFRILSQSSIDSASKAACVSVQHASSHINLVYLLV